MGDEQQTDQSAEGTNEPVGQQDQPSADHPLNSWFDKWFPENSGGKPVAYLSAEWLHVKEAFEELKARFDELRTDRTDHN